MLVKDRTSYQRKENTFGSVVHNKSCPDRDLNIYTPHRHVSDLHRVQDKIFAVAAELKALACTSSDVEEGNGSMKDELHGAIFCLETCIQLKPSLWVNYWSS